MTDIPWHVWVAAQMRRCGFDTQADLVKGTGIDRSVVSVWLSGEYRKGPSIENCRRAAKAFGIPLLNVLVAAGHLSRAEAGMKPVPDQLPDIDQMVLERMSIAGLLDEMRRKIKVMERRLADSEEALHKLRASGSVSNDPTRYTDIPPPPWEEPDVEEPERPSGTG